MFGDLRDRSVRGGCAFSARKRAFLVVAHQPANSRRHRPRGWPRAGVRRDPALQYLPATGRPGLVRSHRSYQISRWKDGACHSAAVVPARAGEPPSPVRRCRVAPLEKSGPLARVYSAPPRRCEKPCSWLVTNSSSAARPSSFCRRARRIASPIWLGSSTRSLHPPRSRPILA